MSPSRAVGDATPLLWLHGFTQTGHSAHAFRAILSASRPILTPDLPGHGANWAVDGTLDEVADFVVRQFPNEPIDVGGYSFGGRVALHVALAHPDRVRRLVVLSGTRGIADATQRAARRARDEDLANRIESLDGRAFVAQWLTQPMFAQLPRDPDELAARSTAHPEGLANSLRHCGTGTQHYLGPALATCEVPALFVAGAADERFAAEARALAATVPDGVFALVPGANHAAHLHQPAWCAAVVDHFLRG